MFKWIKNLNPFKPEEKKSYVREYNVRKQTLTFTLRDGLVIKETYTGSTSNYGYMGILLHDVSDEVAHELKRPWIRLNESLYNPNEISKILFGEIEDHWILVESSASTDSWRNYAKERCRQVQESS